MVEWMISSSVLIVLVMAMRGLFRKKLPMRVWYALWLLVAVRLLVPVSFAESGLSVLNFFAPENRGQAAGAQEGPGSAGMGAAGPGYQPGRETEAADGTENAAVSVPDRAQQTQSLSFAADGQSPGTEPDRENGFAGTGAAGMAWTDFAGGHSALWYVWLTGALLWAGGILISNGQYRRRVYRSRKRWEVNSGSRLPVYVSPVVDSPCMFGLIHPAVYLSREAAQRPETLRYVLCHEIVHYRHFDNLWVVVRAVCLCLHWYNPLVWTAAALSEQDGELACDERTLEILGQEERIRYGRALLDFSAQGSPWQRGWRLFTAMSSGKKLLKERLLVIVGEPRLHAGALALAMLLTVLGAAVTFTGRVEGREPEESASVSLAVPVDTGEERRENAPAKTTAIVPVDLGDGREYALKISGEAVSGNSVYRIGRIDLNWVHDRTQDTLQTIRPEDVRVLYTRSLEDIRNGDGQMYSYASAGEPLYAKPLRTQESLPAREVGKFLADENGEIFSSAPDARVVVADLNFDGYQDFCVQSGTGTVNVPYYCYLWDPEERRFSPGYMIPNVEIDEAQKLIKSATDDGDGIHSVKYYRFDERNLLHMVRYVEENQAPDAVFPTLDLTYCEAFYALPAVDEWDYGTRCGGALTERFVYWAKQALTELYEWSGTKIQKACFAVTEFGDISFGNTIEEVESSLIYFNRCYGARAGFAGGIEQMGVSTERTAWFSPVIQWNMPENPDEMTDHQLVEWYFGRAPLAEGETLASVEGVDFHTYIVLAESGNYYQIYLNGETRELSAMYGPYESRPE